MAARRADGRTNAVADRTTRSVREILRANLLTRFNLLLGSLGLLVLATGDWRDALFGWILVINAAIGIAQEARAKRTLDRLALLHAPRVTVIRGGRDEHVGLDDVVLDDLVRLAPGDQVPADGVVVAATGLEVDESLLTGEADPVPRPVGDPLLSGSFAVAGRGVMRTTAVGTAAYARRLTAETRRFTRTGSELQGGVERLLTGISWSIVVIGPVLLASERMATGSWRAAVTGTAAGIVGMVPQGLVLLTSLAFLLAALALTRDQVLVQQLPAVETLARVDVVCLDKTGTLTEGQIDLAGVVPVDADGRPGTAFTLEGVAPDWDGGRTAVLAAALAALAGDPAANATTTAIARAVPGGPVGPVETVTVGRVPFASARAWSSVSVAGHGTWILGAPEVVFAGSPHWAEATPLRDTAQAATAASRRVVALASAEDPPAGGSDGGSDGGVVLPRRRPVALVLLEERLRTDAADTLAWLADQGVAVRVLSGDHPGTVASVAARVGLSVEGDPVDSRAVADSGDALADTLERHSVFGRVAPHHKRAMVAALQSRHHVVAMTGDGVNDALALKQADIGLAMGSGAAATRAVAPLVLLDNRFAHLPRIVAEGRRVMANIERVATLFVVKNVYSAVIALTMAASTLAGNRRSYPLLPRHFTLVDSLTIGIPAFLLAFTRRAPRYEPGFLRRVLLRSAPTGLLTGIGVVAASATARAQGASEAHTKAAAAIALSVTGLWVVTLVARPLRPLTVALVGAMASLLAAALLVPAASSFFAVRTEPAYAAGAVAVGALTAALIELTWRRWGLRPPSPARRRAPRRHRPGPGHPRP